MFDPRRGGGYNTDRSPSGGVAAGTGAPPLLTRAVPQSVPARVSVVWVEETPERSAGKLLSVSADENWRTIAGAVSPAGVADIVDSVVSPTIAGATPPADVAKVVAADAASLANAGILFPAVPAGIPFPADPVGTLSLPDQNGTLSPTDLAGILFPADPLEYCFRPFLLGYRSQQTPLGR